VQRLKNFKGRQNEFHPIQLGSISINELRHSDGGLGVKIKQRLCGFRGHQSILLTAEMDKKINHVQLKCVRCGFKTKWFRLEKGD